MPATNDMSVKALEILGVDPKNLGCVMLDVRLPERYRAALAPEWAYYSSTMKFINGYEGQTHITLLYGLLLSAQSHRELVDGVLSGWVAPSKIGAQSYGVGVFKGNDGVADYGAIVLHIDDKAREYAWCRDANVSLANLPHVSSFPTYKAHITVGYVYAEFIEQAMAELRMLEPENLPTTGLNYGS